MTSSTPTKPRYRVLVVDDEPALLLSVEAVLADDFDVTTCQSAHEALALLEKQDFHVVCSDNQMPGMTGVELLKRVATLPQAASCILLTGAPDAIKDGEDEGQIVAVVAKPFDPKRLLRLVEQLARLTEVKRAVTSVSLRRRVPVTPT